MDTDDIEPLSKPQELKDLEVMSIEALNTYIEKLKTEIERAEAQIASKKSHRNAANSFFGKKNSTWKFHENRSFYNFAILFSGDGQT